jgi:hypothetical protein
MVMIVVLSIGVPLVLGLIKRWERQASRPQMPSDASARLERIEQAIDAMSIEVERISESQRFVARLMSERAEPLPLPAKNDAPAAERRVIGGRAT